MTACWTARVGDKLRSASQLHVGALAYALVRGGRLPKPLLVNGTRLLSATSYRPSLSAVRPRRQDARTSKADLMVLKTAL
jgi:hypothetical protein